MTIYDVDGRHKGKRVTYISVLRGTMTCRIHLADGTIVERPMKELVVVPVGDNEMVREKQCPQ